MSICQPCDGPVTCRPLTVGIASSPPQPSDDERYDKWMASNGTKIKWNKDHATGFACSHECCAFEQLFLDLLLLTYSFVELLMLQQCKGRWLLTARWISILGVVGWSQINFHLEPPLSLPLNMPVAFLKVPCDAWGCGETPMNTGSIQSLHQASPPMCLW